MTHGCSCDCCVGVEPATPQRIDNRPGLPEIAYRAGVYAQFRASLHAGLSSQQRPGLAALSTRDDRDFTIALLDATACMADVITFYNERLVNEAYLGTAVDRGSVEELLRLLGYRLRPGVAAATHLAFHVEPPPPPVVNSATSPFRKIRIPPSVTIPAGVGVRSIPGPGEQPQVFETIEQIDARPGWNQLEVLAAAVPALGPKRTSMYVQGVSANLKAGDILLFTGASGWEMRPIAAVTLQRERERTFVSWRQPLTAAAPLTPHVMRKRLNVFGYNAPMWQSMSKEFKNNYYYHGENLSDWPHFEIREHPALLSIFGSFLGLATDAGPALVDVDGSHPELAGHRIILSADSNHKLFSVNAVTELARAEFAVSGKVTRLAISGNYTDWYDDWNDFLDLVRETTVHALDEKLALAEEPLSTRVKGNQIQVKGDVTALPPGRTLLVVGDGGSTEIATLATATLIGRDVTNLTLTADLTRDYNPSQVSVFGNVAAATHGETVRQILGNGDASVAFQRFELKHRPLTYVPSQDASGATSTLQIRVNDVAWHEVSSLYPTQATDRAFVTATTPAATVEAGTGDGIRGARVPSGQHNVRASYRKGIGAAGNVPAGALTQLASPPLGVTGVTNPEPALGGADPDSADTARSAGPIFTRTLDRAVSLTDYADFARAFAGIAKSHATVLTVGNVRTIVVTVAAEGGTLVPAAVRDRLAAALRGHGDPLAPVAVVPHRPVRFAVDAKIRRDPDREHDTVFKAAATRLQTLFCFDARNFTQPVQRSEVIAAIQSVPGVIGVDLDRLCRVTQATDQSRLLADGPTLSATVISGAEHLIVIDDPLSRLTEMP
jgi:predicted phage baseplate assembly protein